MATTGIAHSAGLEDHDTIRMAARDFVNKNIEHYARAPQIEVGQLDHRLRLADCKAPLETFMPSHRKLIGNVTVGVRCSEPKPWTLYVPVRIRVFDEVVVAKRMLPRNSLLQKEDVGTELREISSLHGRYMRDVRNAMGRIARQSLPAGRVIMPNNLQKPKVIRRGEQITILATTRGIEVRMTGTAMADGSAGEKIRVKNSRSKRIVRGMVLPQGMVRVSM